ncbi:FAD-dependent monooxygenase [Pseudonocardia sp. CA-107938]|uniref:FAD-dependent monooxygenase n=1 Tax=Pseudonocardia sp. CA-107938 TaxID=3240021 RepID=UPI003D8EB8D5
MSRVLISGASAAGPALALWLYRAGHEVTVVERSPAVRDGGYPIDLRGVAIDVVERMGLLDEVVAADIATRAATFVDDRGRIVASLAADRRDAANRDVELPRGDLTAILYAATRNDVEYVFSDSIAGLQQDPSGVGVTFERSAPRTFDLVVGADGLHSIVRRLAFGPEERYRHDLGLNYAGFSVPNTFGLAQEAVIYNVPGRAAALYAVRGRSEVIALLAFAGPPSGARHDVAAQQALVTAAFTGLGWHVPEVLGRMEGAADFYFDTVSQVRMPEWTRGRVALVGDAGYAPSFLSGQGTSLAVVGAYVLAGAPDVATALPAYDRALRDYVERNQGLAAAGGRMILPRTRAALWRRNALLRLAPLAARLGLGQGPDRAFTEATTAIRLDELAAPAGVSR